MHGIAPRPVLLEPDPVSIRERSCMSEPKQKPATPPLPEPRSVPGVQVRKRYYFVALE